MDLFEYADQQSLQEKEKEPKTEEREALREAIFTVGQITAEVKHLIGARFGQEDFWVKGELSNFKGRNQSGHMYFRLKDDRAVLNCVFFRNANQKSTVDLKEGMEILAHGHLDVWEKGGNYQLIVEEVRPGGIGELYLRFEQLKQKLEQEGLFAPERKKPIPAYPKRIGLVTSPTGAVIRDIIHVIRRRCPFVSLLLVPVKVQGDGAKEEIAKAIAELNRPEHAIDTLIVGRGGGSIEDLWAFNEEIVARAVAASRVPVISAVGHQTDFTITDFAADIRAATPSQAAELAVPDVAELKRRADLLLRNIVQELVRSRDVAHEQLTALRRSAPLRDPMSLVRERTQRLDLAVERMIGSLKVRKERDAERVLRTREHIRLLRGGVLEHRLLRFQRISSNLELLSPLGVLARGFSVVRTERGNIVKRSRQVKPGEDVSVRLHEGELSCQIKKILS